MPLFMVTDHALSYHYEGQTAYEAASRWASDVIGGPLAVSARGVDQFAVTSLAALAEDAPTVVVSVLPCARLGSRSVPSVRRSRLPRGRRPRQFEVRR